LGDEPSLVWTVSVAWSFGFASAAERKQRVITIVEVMRHWFWRSSEHYETRKLHEMNRVAEG
jgi:hypothetical protein